jgi:Skp family chaperone for outer membrane proteins
MLTAALVLLAVRPADGTSATLADNTVVAVVNPTQVLEGLVERAEAEAQLRAKFEELKAQANARTSEIRTLQEQLEGVTDATARESLLDTIDAKGVKAIAFDQFAARQFDVDLALLQQDLYNRIVLSVGELAQANGIDIVLVNDNAIPIQVNPELRVPRATQVEEQIAQRRVMFAAGSVDVTEALILRMNNAHSERTGQR